MIYIGLIYLILRLAGQIIVAAATDSDDDDWIIIDKNIKKYFKTNSSPYNHFFMEFAFSFSQNLFYFIKISLMTYFFITFYI